MVYKNGLSFGGELPDNIKDLVQRVVKNKASLIILSGGLGEGKTTLLVHILDYINSLKGLPEIDLVEGTQIAMGGIDFIHKISDCYKLKMPCIGYDEAGDFSRRGALTNFNAMMNRVFDTFRAFKCVVVVALPNFDILDMDLFDKKIPRLLLNLKDRGDNCGNYDAYSLYRMLLLKSYMKKLNIKNYAFSLVEPNFRGHFLDLTQERRVLLDTMSTKSKFSILKKTEVRIEGLLTYPELATKLMKSVSWVRASVSNLKIKQVRIIDRVKYFDKYALDLLSEHLDSVSERPDRRSKNANNKM